MSVAVDFSEQGAFDEAAIAVMSKAYEFGCVALKDRPEGDKERLARLIIDLAKEGERDVVNLCSKAVNAIAALN